jgi:aldehyde:ferredoxin oxidoreductase
MKRGINTLLGATADDDRLPARLLTPHQDGPTAGESPDLATMLAEFYAVCDLDARGCPSRARLQSLGLDDLASAV